MASKKPIASVIIKFFDERTEVRINGFEKITPAKIQRSFDFVLKEWHLQQQKAIHANRKKEEEARLEAIAAEQEEQQDAA